MLAPTGCKHTFKHLKAGRYTVCAEGPAFLGELTVQLADGEERTVVVPAVSTAVISGTVRFGE